MAGKTFSEDLSNEMVGKTVMWGPAIVGGILLGPVGVGLGLIASVVAVASGGNNNSAPPKGEQPRK